MYVTTLLYPGRTLSSQWSVEVLPHLLWFEMPLAEAAFALTWFEETRSSSAFRILPEKKRQILLLHHAKTFLSSLCSLDRHLQISTVILGAEVDLSDIN